MLPRMVVLLAVAAGLVALAIYLPVEFWLTALAQWAEFHPVRSFAAFAGLVVLGMLLMIPVALQAMAAGFIFGFAQGLAIMYAGGLLGFAATFLVGKNLVRPWVERWVRRRPEFGALDEAIGRNGFVIVMLARLSQVLPYNLLNYSFGVTAVGLKDCLLGSAAGMLPGVAFWVYIGSTATDLAAIMDGELGLGDVEFWVMGAGFAVLILLLWLVSRFARNTLGKQLGVPVSPKPPQSED